MSATRPATADEPVNPAAVYDPRLIAEIRDRTAYARLRWWQRLTTPTPPGWRDVATGPIH